MLFLLWVLWCVCLCFGGDLWCLFSGLLMFCVFSFLVCDFDSVNYFDGIWFFGFYMQAKYYLPDTGHDAGLERSL